MNGKQQDFERRKRRPGKRCVVIFITVPTLCSDVYNGANAELALTSFQLMKVCGDSGLHLFEQKENLMVGHQVRVTFLLFLDAAQWIWVLPAAVPL